MNDNMKRLEARTAAAAEAALAARKFVTAIDVLEGIGWLPQVHVDEWRQERCIEQPAQDFSRHEDVPTLGSKPRTGAKRDGLRLSNT